MKCILCDPKTASAVFYFYILYTKSPQSSTIFCSMFVLLYTYGILTLQTHMFTRSIRFIIRKKCHSINSTISFTLGNYVPFREILFNSSYKCHLLCYCCNVCTDKTEQRSKRKRNTIIDLAMNYHNQV